MQLSNFYRSSIIDLHKDINLCKSKLSLFEGSA